MAHHSCLARKSALSRLAYTLTEFLAVSTILAILAAILGPRVYDSNRRSVREAATCDRFEPNGAVQEGLQELPSAAADGRGGDFERISISPETMPDGAPASGTTAMDTAVKAGP